MQVRLESPGQRESAQPHASGGLIVEDGPHGYMSMQDGGANARLNERVHVRPAPVQQNTLCGKHSVGGAASPGGRLQELTQELAQKDAQLRELEDYRMLDETMDSILPPADVGEALKAPTHVVAELARRRREYEGLVARYRSLSAHCLRVESKCSEKDKARLEIAKPQCWEPLCLDPRLNPCARVCSRGSPLRPVLQVVRCPRGIGGLACQTARSRPDGADAGNPGAARSHEGERKGAHVRNA